MVLAKKSGLVISGRIKVTSLISVLVLPQSSVAEKVIMALVVSGLPCAAKQGSFSSISTVKVTGTSASQLSMALASSKAANPAVSQAINVSGAS